MSKTLALTIHRQQIERFGGTQGIRDEALLESALGAARQIWHYSGDIFQTAAQYCYSLANNHPFLDGNKRAPAACMLVFLAANRKQPAMDNPQLYEWVISVATRQLSRDELAELLKQHCK